MSEFKVPSWLVRNPLGIVALFISLIYAMRALLLGASVKDLLPQSQIALVAFIVLFPVLVLSVFAWLVSRHHTKLYGPGDYRSDKGFLDAGRTVSADLVGKRLEKEIEEGEEEEELNEVEVRAEPPSGHSVEQKIENIIFSTGSGRSRQLNQAYVAEGLVFQALQAELGGSIRREVRIDGAHLDGLIYQPDGIVTVVEIKIISSSINFQRRIREAHFYFEKIRPALKKEGIETAKFLLAIVIDGNPGRVHELRSKLAQMGLSFDVRVYWLAELMRQFGLDEPSKPSPP